VEVHLHVLRAEDLSGASGNLDSAGGRRTTRTMGKILCRIGVHRWHPKRNPESGETYRECERCQKQKTITLSDTGIEGTG
jgi:hypothetical protein